MAHLNSPQRSRELGNVQAPNAKAAEAAAIADYKLDEEQRKRLVVQEREKTMRKQKETKAGNETADSRKRRQQMNGYW